MRLTQFFPLIEWRSLILTNSESVIRKCLRPGEYSLSSLEDRSEININTSPERAELLTKFILLNQKRELFFSEAYPSISSKCILHFRGKEILSFTELEYFSSVFFENESVEVKIISYKEGSVYLTSRDKKKGGVSTIQKFNIFADWNVLNKYSQELFSIF